MEIPNDLTLERDSCDYEVLYYAAIHSMRTEGASCEIGVRLGGSSEIILRANQNGKPKPHVIIDPWGDVPHAMDERKVCLGYTSSMRRKATRDLSILAEKYDWDILLFWMKDTDFFIRFADGVPYYPDGQELLITKYSLVHFDGPHSVEDTGVEINFFGPRSVVGSWWVFDDIPLYPHCKLENLIQSFGFKRNDDILFPSRERIWKHSYERVT